MSISVFSSALSFNAKIFTKRADSMGLRENLRKRLGMARKPLKHPHIGLECEFMIMDNAGRMSNSADLIIKKSRGLVKKECSRNIIEIDASPSRIIPGTTADLLERALRVLEVMERKDYRIYPYGTYPGKFNPSMRKESAYAVKEKIFGREKFTIAGRCIGFHCHHDLPKGMFDPIGKHVKVFINSKLSGSLVGSYNMLIAMDPAFTVFAQSSPYYQGRLYGKDARMMLYRGSPIFGVSGLYTDFQDFGALPPYNHTMLDIVHVVEDRFREWSRLMKSLKINVEALTLYGSVLDTNWSPVKINPNGTLEMRGMDMNKFGVVVSLAVTMDNVLKHINENRMRVLDSDIAMREPFKIEGDTIYVPPYSYVFNALQRDSALRGMESPYLRTYCSKLLGMAAKIMPPESRKFLKPLNRMVTKKRTVSDRMISRARKMGHRETLPQAAAAEIALKMSESVHKDIARTMRLVSGLVG